MKFNKYCRWFRNPANQLKKGKFPTISRVSYMSGGAGFLPSTVSMNLLLSEQFA